MIALTSNLQEIMRGYEALIADGVNIISVSLGSEEPREYFKDPIAIGSFHAMRKGILTSNSVGNARPFLRTVSNFSPWSLTVAAGTIDREICVPSCAWQWTNLSCLQFTCGKTKISASSVAMLQQRNRFPNCIHKFMSLISQISCRITSVPLSVYVPPMGVHGYSNNLAYPHPSNGTPTGFGSYSNPAGYTLNAQGTVGGATGLDDSTRMKYKDGNIYVPNPQEAIVLEFDLDYDEKDSSYNQIKSLVTEEFKQYFRRVLSGSSYGVRPLRIAIMRLLEDSMAEKMPSGDIKEGDFVIVDVDAVEML
ncbi:hypothetical protein IFM89_012263 [Coptis chinensis]|uniref:Peptidase S8/S53 domain-containing protein n=1 Tax=Coptis chinensis TaxID=261450 RepID=A0A835HDU4_9MAGN|nr:hypothetical protein IFM89_012263 [Coptis chinensis]